jgi:hypothetical protein
MKRAKNLTNSDIALVIGILDGFAARLTWESLIDEIERGHNVDWCNRTRRESVGRMGRLSPRSAVVSTRSRKLSL